jgi:chemotaxis protein MotB
MRDILADREGVRIVGDRFVFSSEVLFELGSADLAPEGRSQIANVVEILSEVATVIPDQIDWILRVDGHTDDLPIAPGGRWSNNWELSQARALAVVLYMIEELGFPPTGWPRPASANTGRSARGRRPPRAPRTAGSN